MQLSFEYDTTAFTLGSGHAPQVIHDNFNRFRLIYLDDTGLVKCKETAPALGQYASLTFTDKGRVSPDETVSKPSIKRVAHYGAYGFWSAEGDHRFVMYMLPTDISNAFMDGNTSRTLNQDSASLSLTLANVKGQILNRNRSLVSPGVKLELYFSIAGDEIPLGVYYIDRATVDYPAETVSVNARDAIGKLLKEQTFDETTTFTEGSTHDNIEAIMQYAEIESYFVGDPGTDEDLTFDPDTTILEGIKYAITNFANWVIRENMDGTVGVALKTDARFDPATLYDFQRDHTCWSYNIDFDDSDAAARVCVVSEPTEESGETVRVYQSVTYNKWWEQPLHRTLYVNTAKGASSAQCNAIAQRIAQSLADSGRTETFAGIFTPQLVIGDEVRVTDENERVETVGTITDIKHNFGRGGFYTSFTVDSGGRRGRDSLKDLVQVASDFPAEFTGIQAETQDGDDTSY